MKKLGTFVLLLLCCLPWRMMADTRTAFQFPDFNYPVDVNLQARSVLDSALLSGDDKLAVMSLSQIALARSVVTKYNSDEVIALIDSVSDLRCLAPDYQALLWYLKAVYIQDLPSTGFVNRDEGPEIYNWGINRRRALIVETYKKCLDPLGNGEVSCLQQPVEKYEGVLTIGDELGRRCVPTLYDMICLKTHDYYGMKQDSIRKQWTNFHLSDKDFMPSAFVYAQIEGRKSGAGNKLYKKYGKKEELGLFLLNCQTSIAVKKDYLKRYPNSIFSPEIRSKLAYDLRQIIEFRNEGVLFSSDSIKALSIIFDKYSDSCTLLLYRIPEELYQMQDSLSIDQLTLVDQIVAHKEKMISRSKVAFSPQPYGRYTILPRFFIEDGTYQEKKVLVKEQDQIIVSDLRTFDVTTDSCRKVFVVDGHNGNPVANAVVRYECQQEDTIEVKGELMTNEQGFVSLPQNAKVNYSFSKGLDNKNRTVSLRRHYSSELMLTKVSFFTDLPMYRPGETIQFAAVAYQSLENRREVLSQFEYTVKLLNTSHETIDSLQVKSDDYGQVSGRFVIPMDQKNGRFSISAYSPDGSVLGTEYFQTSEYKLPNYYLDLSDTPIRQKKGRRMIVKGRVLSFTGMPVANAEVDVKFDLDYIGRGWDKEDDWVDYDFKVKTDADGRFSHKCRFQPKWLELRGPLRYSVWCYVETEDGEDFAEWTIITKGKIRDARLDLEGNEILLMKPNSPLKLPVEASSNAKDVKIRYTLFDDDDKKVKRGTFSADSAFVDWSDLPPGDYYMTWRVKGSTIKDEVDLTLLQEDGQQMPDDIEFYAPDSLQSVDSLGVAHLTFYTSNEGEVYYTAYYQNQEVASGWVAYHPGRNNVDLPQCKMSDGGNLFVNLFSCYQGKLNHKTLDLNVPEQKTIYLRKVSFRDKITPGDKEHWSFSLLDADRKPVQGRMMLELYSKAVESKCTHNWAFPRMPRLGNPVRFHYPGNYSKSSLFTYIKPIAFDPYQKQFPEINLWGMTFDKAFRANIVQPIIITPKPLDPTVVLPADSTVVNGNKKLVSGMVLSADDGEPMIGVAIAEKGTTNGTLTDADGIFQIEVSPNAILVVSYVGYATQNVATGGYSRIKIELEEDCQLLEDVIVVGYGAMKKSSVTGIVVKERREFPGNQEQALQDVEPRLGDVKVALWRPSIQTDSLGTLTLDFDVVNENNTWCLQALAYDRELNNAIFKAQVLSQRPVMVQPMLPRFLRVGDSVTLKAAVENATDSLQHIAVLIELFDPQSGEVWKTERREISQKAQSRETLSIEYQAPVGATMLGFRIKAVNDRGDSDGEQQQIPVLPAISDVLQTKPFFLTAQQPNISLQLPVADIDTTSRVSLQYCNNPVWTCMDALPTLADDDRVTSTGLAHSLYAIAVSDRLRDVDTTDYQPIIGNLRRSQHSDGGFSWAGGSDSQSSLYWATGNVIETMGDLLEVGCLPQDSLLDCIITDGLRYLDNEICQWAAKEPSAVSQLEFLPYAYTRTMFGGIYAPSNDSIASECQKLIDLTVETLKSNWKTLPLAERAFAAMLLHRKGHGAVALDILESLRQLAVRDSVRGMYWENLNRNSSYYHPVACTALMLQAFAEVGREQYASSIELMRQWLLIEKQTTDWGSSSLASHAVHGLLLSGRDWRNDQEGTTSNAFQISIDGKEADCAVEDQQRGSVNMEIPASSHIVEVSRKGDHPAWGALSHRHIVPIEYIKADSLPELSVRKELWVEDEDDEWVLLTDSSTLKVGDHVKVRLVITCRQDFDGMRLQDERPAFLEPKDYISGYRWGWSSHSYYQEIKDACMNFFFDRLREGVHEVSYYCTVTNAGSFSAGMATIQCQLAPQFAAHTEGRILEVKARNQ